MSQHFDAIIIGAGQAGPSLAARFSAAGMAVDIIERHKFGGTCVNTGCIPTKTLIAGAYAAHVGRRGAEYGFVVNGDVSIDMKRVKARKDEVAGRSNKGVIRKQIDAGLLNVGYAANGPAKQGAGGRRMRLWSREHEE